MSAYTREQRDAYRAGWNASKRTRTYDLDAAESRFCSKHADPGNYFSKGWCDYAADYEYSLDTQEEQGQGK